MDDNICYVIVNNIPKTYHSSDLRNFFSQFVETCGFACFHFRHRPEVQKPSETKVKQQSLELKDMSRCVTTCCVAKIHSSRVNEFIHMYHNKHWVDGKGNTMLTKCFIKKIRFPEVEKGDKDDVNIESSESSTEKELFTMNDLSSLIEMKPPTLMPQGNVGTPTKYFLEQIQACRLPPSIITKLKLEFPQSRAKRLYGSVNFDYDRNKIRHKKKEQETEEVPLLRTGKGDIVSDTYTEMQPSKVAEEAERAAAEQEKENDEESEEEEWDRHETLHNDVTQQERLKERLFEEKIELKWEKGGSGLVFYTDAQFWDEKEGDFDAKTADDWDIDMSGYYERGSGDKDARDMIKMRLEERLRQGTYSETDVNDFAAFEKHTKGFGRRVLESHGWKEGQGVGKLEHGRAEPILDLGQNPRDKKGFGYRGEKLQRHIPLRTKSKCKRRHIDDTECFRISTIYDDPLQNDPPEHLLRSSFLTKLKYRKDFLKQTSSANIS